MVNIKTKTTQGSYLISKKLYLGDINLQTLIVVSL